MRSSQATDSASRWLVGSSSSSRSGLDSSSRHRATRRRSPPDSVVTSRVARREAQGVHGDLEGAVEVPGAGGVDLVLELGLLGQQLVEVGVGLAHGRADLVEAVERGRLVSATPSATLPSDVLVRVELRLLGEEADGEARREAGLAGEAVVLARHDRSSEDLPEPFAADDADLGARVEGEVDAAQHLAVGRVEAPQVAHGEDVLSSHAHSVARPRRARYPGATGPAGVVRGSVPSGGEASAPGRRRRAIAAGGRYRAGGLTEDGSGDRVQGRGSGHRGSFARRLRQSDPLAAPVGAGPGGQHRVVHPRPQGDAGRRQPAVDEDALPGCDPAQGVGRGQPPGGRRRGSWSARPAPRRRGRQPRLLVADQVAGVLEGRRVRDPRQEDLGPVVVHHRRRPRPVAGGHLGQVVPDGHQLDAVAGRRGRQRVEVGQRGDVGRLVQHHQQRRVEGPARPGHPGDGVGRGPRAPPP